MGDERQDLDGWRGEIVDSESRVVFYNWAIKIKKNKKINAFF